MQERAGYEVRGTGSPLSQHVSSTPQRIGMSRVVCSRGRQAMRRARDRVSRV